MEGIKPKGVKVNFARQKLDVTKVSDIVLAIMYFNIFRWIYYYVVFAEEDRILVLFYYLDYSFIILISSLFLGNSIQKKNI